MQLNVLSALSGQGANASGASSLSADAGGSPNLFSKLLSDAESEGNPDPKTASSALPADSSSAALLAQEAARAPATDPSQAALQQEVTAQDAADLIAKIDTLQAGLSAQDDGSKQAWQQLKQALQDVAASGKPQKLEDILHSVPGMQTLAKSEQTPLMQRMMAWLQAAIAKNKEAPEQAQAADAETATVPAAVTQSLQAAMFPSGDAADTPPQDKDKKTRTSIEIIPLSQPATLPDWAVKIVDGDTQSSPAIDAAIPPLALKGDEALPAVNLPGSDSKAADANAAKIEALLAPLQAPIAALHSERVGTKADMAKAVDGESQVLADLADAKSTTLQNLSNTSVVHATGALTAPATQASAPPLQHMPTPLRVPVTDQVHVAITQGMHDGTGKITIQLEPNELGRVEVTMNTSADGTARISFTADKASTLDMLSRDAHMLERSLQDSGVKADAGTMQFNLRQQPQPQFTRSDMGQGGQGNPQAQPGEESTNDSGKVSSIVPAAITKNYTMNIREGVDIHV